MKRSSQTEKKNVTVRAFSGATTSLPACNPVTTSSLFEPLPFCPTDDADVISAPSLVVQMENVRLQRQVQFLGSSGKFCFSSATA